ncbi:YdaU family protein [Sphingosinicellaceae bacterium]|nr:YdaU family protein [Sphingosinicellaceae bacterium]
MSGPAWYRRNPIDHLSEVQGLGADAIGALSVLTDMIFARGGPVAADYRHLAGVLGSSPRLTRSLVDRLIKAGKIELVDDHWTIIRVEKEIENIANRSRTQAETGAKGGRTTAENNARAKENSNLNPGSLKPKREEIRAEEIRERHNGATSGPTATGKAGRLALDFKVPLGWKTWAMAERKWSITDAEVEAANFVSAKANGASRPNWMPTFQIWCRNSTRPPSEDYGASVDPAPGPDTHDETEAARRDAIRLPDDFVFQDEWLRWAAKRYRWTPDDALSEADAFSSRYGREPGPTDANTGTTTDWYAEWQYWCFKAQRGPNPDYARDLNGAAVSEQ